MNIRFTSTLTPEDENALAPAILAALSGILDILPLAYVIRIDTTDAQVYQRSSSKGIEPATSMPTRTPRALDSDW